VNIPTGDAEQIARVFPRRTSLTPSDELSFIGDPPLWLPSVEEVHVSCVFTWDSPEARRLALVWKEHGYQVSLGGPAFDAPGGRFESGKYIKRGGTITSRGCIRQCPFCFVHKREGKLRLLSIVPGHDILDNNILACPREHIEAVLSMLDEQKKAARFTGGIDARLIGLWFVKRLSSMRLDILYTAYDHPTQAAATERCVKMLADAGIKQRKIGCYVLVGYENDTLEQAESRLSAVKDWGGMPFAMFYQPPTEKKRKVPGDWKKLVRSWSRPAAIFAKQGKALAEKDAQKAELDP